jgi:hypothetical protein
LRRIPFATALPEKRPGENLQASPDPLKFKPQWSAGMAVPAAPKIWNAMELSKP